MSVEFNVTLYPRLGAGDGAVQETRRRVGKSCSAVRLVRGTPSSMGKSCSAVRLVGGAPSSILYSIRVMWHVYSHSHHARITTLRNSYSLVTPLIYGKLTHNSKLIELQSYTTFYSEVAGHHVGCGSVSDRVLVHSR